MVSTKVQLGTEFLVNLLPSEEACAAAARTPSISRAPKKTGAPGTTRRLVGRNVTSSVTFSSPLEVASAQGDGSGRREPPPIILHCRVARVRQESDLSTLLGAEFIRLMIPSPDSTIDPQAMGGLLVEALLWTDILAETPADPFNVLDPTP